MQLKGFVKCFVVGNGVANAGGDDNFRWVEDGWPVHVVLRVRQQRKKKERE
jgi:hypothetical protein